MIYYDIQPSIFNANTVVACTKQGICATLFGYNIESATHELHKMFPEEDLYLGSVRSQNYAFKFTTALDNDRSFNECYINIVSGTPFQRLVWENLRKIPRGTTITYAELAAQIGMPTAVRAVASAVGKNPISVIIPCHRVVPKSGGTGKYRWGSEMKAKLIEREKSHDQ
jgi:O-6-methylguanine DNA methyltransferase